MASSEQLPTPSHRNLAQHVFFTEVKEGKFSEYKHYHDNIWPDVVSGLRTNGVSYLSIYNVPNTKKLVMIVEMAGGVDMGKALGPGSRYRENPKCKEWEELMDADFHGGWIEMNRIHSSEKEWNKSLGLC